MAQPYGTVMVGRLAVPFDEMAEAARRWAAVRQVPGFLHEEVMLCDDGETVVMVVFFDSQDSYRSLAENPEQDRWWREVAGPALADDPTWHDGTWRLAIDAA